MKPRDGQQLVLIALLTFLTIAGLAVVMGLVLSIK